MNSRERDTNPKHGRHKPMKNYDFLAEITRETLSYIIFVNITRSAEQNTEGTSF